MKWKLSQPEPATLVYYFMKLIGLAPFRIDKDGFHPPTLLDKLYLFLVASVYFWITANAAKITTLYVMTFNVSKIAVVGTIIQSFNRIPGTITTLMLFQFKYKKILHIVNNLDMISKELTSFGIVHDRKKFVKNIFVTIVIMNAVLVPMYIVVTFMNAYSKTLDDINYAVDHYVGFHTILIYVQTLFFMRNLFKQLNDKLYDVFRASGDRLDRSGPIIVTENHRQDCQAHIEDLTDLERIQKIKALHLELCNLLEQTVQFFAIPILLRTIQSYTDLIVYCFWIYFDFRYFGRDVYTADIFKLVLDLFLGSMRIILVLTPWIVAARASVKTCQEGNATRIVISEAWYKFKPRKVEDEIFTFSLQLLQKPVVISALGLLDMDYSYLFKILGSTLTFVIVMVQFDEPSKTLKLEG